MQMVRDTKQIGETSEARVLYELKSLGYTVSTPFGDNAKYDLIFDVDSELYRTQIKTGRLKDNGVVSFKTRTAGHNNTEGTYHKAYNADDIDLFIIFCPQNDSLYAVDICDAPESQMSIRVEEPKNGQTKGINMAEDYLLTKRFK